MTIVTILPSGFWVASEAHGKVPQITRRFRATFPSESFYTLFCFSIRKTFSSRTVMFRRLSSVSLCRRSRSRREWLFCCPRENPWLKLHESPFEHCPVAFHWQRFPAFSLNADFLPLWLLTTTPVSILPFWAWKLRVPIIWPMCCLTIVLNLW